jgi:hypothetical protein
MWCEGCQSPVAAQRSTHRLRNATSIGAAPLTGGLSLLGARSDDWCCPGCGGPVKRLPQTPSWLEERSVGDRVYEVIGLVLFALVALTAIATCFNSGTVLGAVIGSLATVGLLVLAGQVLVETRRRRP